MRGFALLLILANFVFFGWSQFVDVPVGQQPVVLNQDNTPRLQLVTERPEPTSAAPRPEAPASDAASASAAASSRCVSVGPFQDLTAAAQASASLQGGGFTARQRIERGEVWVGYWVSVPALPNQPEAEQAMSRLKAGGLNDVYILPGSGNTRVLSLGIFSEVARAQRRVDEARQLGFEPQVSDRKRQGSVYWIDVDLQQPGQTIDPALLQTTGTIVRLEQRPCPAG